MQKKYCEEAGCRHSFYVCSGWTTARSFGVASAKSSSQKATLRPSAKLRTEPMPCGGGTDVVDKSEHIELGRFIALKFLPEELARDPQLWNVFDGKHPRAGICPQPSQHLPDLRNRQARRPAIHWPTMQRRSIAAHPPTHRPVFPGIESPCQQQRRLSHQGSAE